MISHRTLLIICMIWMFGWGVILLRFPGVVAVVRRLAKGNEPSAKDFRTARIMGYMSIFFGYLALLRLILVSASSH